MLLVAAMALHFIVSEISPTITLKLLFRHFHLETCLFPPQADLLQGCLMSPSQAGFKGPIN